MKDCFIYMFKGLESIKNFGIFYTLFFISVLTLNIACLYSPSNMLGEHSPLFIVFLIFGILLLTLPCGHIVNRTKLLINKYNSLPEFDIKSLFISGCKFLISLTILLIPVALILGLLGFVNAFFKHQNWIPLSFLVAAFSFLISITFVFILLASFYNYVKNDDIIASVKMPTIIALINKNVNNYFKYFVIFVILIFLTLYLKEILFFHLNFLGYFGLVIYSLSLGFIYSYFTTILAKMTANSIQE